MNDKKTAEYAPNEKKVWRPETATQVLPPEELNMKPGIYFIAIEELQGAWIDGEWEEADSSETWTETTTDTYTDDDGYDHEVVTVKEFTKDIPRSRRYVLKRFTETGFAENAFSSGFAGPRKYQK
jgi:hypothetical protein